MATTKLMSPQENYCWTSDTQIKQSKLICRNWKWVSPCATCIWTLAHFNVRLRVRINSQSANHMAAPSCLSPCGYDFQKIMTKRENIYCRRGAVDFRGQSSYWLETTESPKPARLSILTEIFIFFLLKFQRPIGPVSEYQQSFFSMTST